MSLLLPPRESPLRDLYDIQTLVAMGANPNKIPSLPECWANASGALLRARLHQEPVVSIACIARQHDGKVVLVEYAHPQAGHLASEAVLWNFSR